MEVLMMLCRRHGDCTIVDRKPAVRVDRAVERITDNANL